eukprot:365667-Chlamydomonas_euryale.AAC.7
MAGGQRKFEKHGNRHGEKGVAEHVWAVEAMGCLWLCAESGARAPSHTANTERRISGLAEGMAVWLILVAPRVTAPIPPPLWASARPVDRGPHSSRFPASAHDGCGALV